MLAFTTGVAATLVVTPGIDAPCASRVQVRLFFGLRTPDGAVSDDEWARFLAEVVTPRFPRGLTVVRAAGQWRPPDRSDVVEEAARVVEIVDDEGTGLQRRAREVVAIYRKQYRQQSVMLTKARVEVCF
jgi:uncharacterized protein DUF3574